MEYISWPNMVVSKELKIPGKNTCSIQIDHWLKGFHTSRNLCSPRGNCTSKPCQVWHDVCHRMHDFAFLTALIFLFYVLVFSRDITPANLDWGLWPWRVKIKAGVGIKTNVWRRNPNFMQKGRLGHLDTFSGAKIVIFISCGSKITNTNDIWMILFKNNTVQDGFQNCFLEMNFGGDTIVLTEIKSRHQWKLLSNWV